jgi:L,D-transpeptidase ErfK/SrfK
MRVTHGCIRMFPEDIEALYKMVPAGTPVNIVNQPYKLGWTEAGLYLEAHPPLLEPEAATQWVAATELTRAYVAATEARSGEFSWDSAERVILAARGIPEFISSAPIETELGVDNDAELAQPLAADNDTELR